MLILCLIIELILSLSKIDNRNTIMPKSKPQNQTESTQRNQPIKQPHHLPEHDHRNNEKRSPEKPTQGEK